jgi:predicted DCC family thiol-disulfide oxidoreductase YuxK
MAKEQPEFLMYGVPDCPFCEEAMQLMLEHCRENNIRFTAHIQDWDNYTIRTKPYLSLLEIRIFSEAAQNSKTT